MQQVNNEEVENGTVSSASVKWTTKDGLQFTTTLPSNYQSQDLLNLLAGKRITVNGTGPSLWTKILFNVLVWVVPFGLLYFFLFRRMADAGAAGPLNLGKNRMRTDGLKAMR